jgi:hypothetical protein|nr:MAG TPA: hypothetical protein [Caudoviricetes sp.]
MATIHLQGIGQHPAKPAGELKVGDTLCWNFGYTSRLTEIVKQTKHTITFRTVSPNGYIGTHHKRLTTLLAVKGLSK